MPSPRTSHKIRYPTDEVLLARVVCGESLAFDMIFDRYYWQISSYVRRRFESNEMVEDIIQEVFLRVFKSARTFNGEMKFSSWIYKIASNEAKRFWRKRVNRQTISLNAPIDRESGGNQRAELIEDLREVPATETERMHMLKSLREHIKQLPEKQRTVVVLKTYENLTFAEISAICNCPLSTVLSRMRYGINKLKLSLGPQEREMVEQLWMMR